MNKEQLRELLHQEYKTENWKKVTEFVFPNVQYLQRPQAIPFSNDKVESFKQIGNVKLTDGKNLAMFEVKVAQNVNLSRNRVELRKLVEKLIDQERNHGVLVIYEQGKEDYRFTFTAKSTEFDEEENDFVDHETDAKRFTYILGKNESCKTAANRFWELSTHKDTATIKDVENAFSVERLNKEFFNKYKAFYEDFVQYITGKRFVKEKGKWVEKKLGRARPIHKEVFDSDDKLARNFVKLLLGRLVFIQFLQKKGWMGVPAASKKWKNGDPEFLFNLYNSAKNKEEFHSKCLYPLFYKAFNTPGRPNDVFPLTGTRVPYLNGGLFENENPETKNIEFPATYFGDLLEFFGQYNFTIDENDPQDHEVGIDPEMLGHIFENLLEDNKDKGAFYTPKPIVQYMCQESLIQYLKTYLQEKQIWPGDEDDAAQMETHLQNFVRRKIAGELLNDYDEHLAKALKEVKICDPAIGSGAFPMGLLNEIFYCMQVLYDASPDTVGSVWEMEDWAPDIVKKNIIQHSIYGVDIEKGAVDIARLRFWLSLIVDEQEPTPLPNLDFKIMQGNSLLESYEGIDLSKIAGTKTVVTEVALDLFGNPVNAQASIFDTKYIDDSNITELIDNYFNTQQPDEKQKLKKEIDATIHKHIDYNLEFEENKILITITEVKKKLNLLKAEKNHSAAVAAKTKKGREKLTKELEDAQEKLGLLKYKRKELHDLQKTAERPYFLWHLYFKDVFEKGGFDIVIGNPPYVNIENIEKRDRESFLKLYGKNGSLGKRYDLYQIFILSGIQKQRENSILNFILPNTFLVGHSYLNLRSQMCHQTAIHQIVDLPQNVFESATVDNVLLFLKKPISNKNTILVNKLLEKASLSKLINRVWDDSFYILQAELCSENQFRINVHSNPLKKRIYNKLFINSKKLGEVTESSQGIIIYKTEEDAVDNLYTSFSYKKGWKKLLRGTNIGRYEIKWDGEYIHYGNWLWSQREEKYFNGPKILLQALRNKSLKRRLVATYDDEKYYNAHNLANIISKSNSDFNLKYILAVFNSTLINVWYKDHFPNVNINPSDFREIPIKIVDNKIQEAFVKLVERILQIKKNSNADSSIYEAQIDLMIYKIYQLSFSEIKTLDPSFGVSEMEYNNLII